MHIPVLLKEVIDGLKILPNDKVFDGTINGGGHSEALSNFLGEEGTLIGVDLDGAALNRAQDKLSTAMCKVILRRESFRNIDKVLSEIGILAVDKIILDLGLSSQQLEESGRGFSFRKNEPLLMTFNDKPKDFTLTAWDIVNQWNEENLKEIIQSYGEERFAPKIAAQIVMARKEKPIDTTDNLVAVIIKAVPKSYSRRKIHPATKTFQALRITVNDEIGALKEVLDKGFKYLNLEGRMAIISFHSIEDRIVKNYFREGFNEGRVERITKKPIVPSREEILLNPRSRSAKLRIIEKK